MNNSLRNYNYLLVCHRTGDAVAIDPLNAKVLYDYAKMEGWSIKAILNTHEHWDHVSGNEELALLSKAPVYAHTQLTGQIPGVTKPLLNQEVITVSPYLEVEALETPGHTQNHLCYLVHGEKEVLFSGDTLFQAGCGNCKNGGSLSSLYETFTQVLNRLPDHTEIYPGHDYLWNNLKFSLSVEPNNKSTNLFLSKLESESEETEQAIVTTLKDEAEFNPFFRSNTPELRESLIQNGLVMEEKSDPRTLFYTLRGLRDHW